MNIQYNEKAIKDIENFANNFNRLFKGLQSAKRQTQNFRQKTKSQNQRIMQSSNLMPSLIKAEQTVKSHLANEKTQLGFFDELKKQNQNTRQANEGKTAEGEKISSLLAYKQALKNVFANSYKHDLNKANKYEKRVVFLQPAHKSELKAEKHFDSFILNESPKNLERKTQIADKINFGKVPKSLKSNNKNIKEKGSESWQALLSSIKDFSTTGGYNSLHENKNKLKLALSADDNKTLNANETKSFFNNTNKENFYFDKHSSQNSEPFKPAEQEFFYDPASLSYAGSGNMATQNSNNNKTYIIDIQGQGKVELDKALIKEQMLDTLVENIKPIFIDMLEEEMFTEGEGSYYF